jgi:hypothetical protein
MPSGSPINVSRLILRHMTIAPDASSPTTLQTFLPRSTPRTEIFAIALPPPETSASLRRRRRGGPTASASFDVERAYGEARKLTLQHLLQLGQHFFGVHHSPVCWGLRARPRPPQWRAARPLPLASPTAGTVQKAIIILLQKITGDAILGLWRHGSWGDKLRIRSGRFAGHRAVLCAIELNNRLSVQLADGSRKSLATTTVTNLSAAARKAWKTMPKRQVGRPTGTKTRDRVSVTLRVDRRLWERFRMQENTGVIEDRCAEIEKLLAAIVSRAGEH